jgi:hypothetical protein
MSTPAMDARAVTEKSSAPEDLRPRYQWGLRMHGFENADRLEGASGQSKDK